MSMNITIRDRIYNKLKSEKGNGSFSDVIELYMNKCEPVNPSAKTDSQASQHTSEGAPACQDSHLNT